MNLQEREQLTTFLHQLAQAQAGYKDADAQALISAAFAQQPDAAYLVVQRALLLDAACKSAEAQIAQLKDQLAQQQRPAAPAPGFLDATTWGRQPVAPPAPVAARPAPVSEPARTAFFAPPTAPTAPAPVPARGFQAPSFLSGMATTAAGVAAGAFLFQGISHLVDGGRPAPLSGAHSAGAPAAASEAPAANHLLDAPAGPGETLADSSTAGFSDLLDIGPDDSSDWT